MYFILLSGKLLKKKFHPSKLNHLNCSSCDRFILGWRAQVFNAFHSAWAVPKHSGSTGTTWNLPDTSKQTLVPPGTNTPVWCHQLRTGDSISFSVKCAGSTQRSLDLVGIYFNCLLFLQLCSDYAGVVCGWWEEQTDGGRLVANILKLEEKRSFHYETCRRINLPSSKCPVCSLLLPFLFILTSFFPYSWINTCNFSSTLIWLPCCRESINKTVNVLVPWLVVL